MPRYRKKPLAQYEFGTRIYAPSGGERRYRAVTVGLVTGQRVFHKFADEDDARAKARELEDLGHPRWALAMRLTARTGLRWGELVALQAGDIQSNPRVVHVRRAVEQGSSGPATVKTLKNGKARTTIYPRSLEPDLRRLVTDTFHHDGPTGLLFPNRAGGFARRSSFQPIWVRAADVAGWPMASPLRRSAGYGEKNKGWRWTGAAKWTPHDLRHVAACWMLFDLGLDPAVVADKLGHADPAFTIRRYIGIRVTPTAPQCPSPTGGERDGRRPFEEFSLRLSGGPHSTTRAMGSTSRARVRTPAARGMAAVL